MSGERINPRDHEVAVKYTFRTKWEQWYRERGMREKPSDGEMFEILRRCVQYLPEELPFPLEHGRLAFHHADYPNQVFVAVLEGVTRFTPVGVLTFIGWVEYENRAVIKGRIDLSVAPTYAPAPDEWADYARENYLTRRLRDCEAWLDRCPEQHRLRKAAAEARDRYASDLAAVSERVRQADTALLARLADLERRQTVLEQAIRELLGG